MKNILFAIIVATILMACPKQTFDNWNDFEYLGAITCDSTKYAILKLVNPNNTELPLKKTDTLSLNGRFYQNVYIVRYFIESSYDFWIQNTTSNVYLVGNDAVYGTVKNCAKVSHLTLLEVITPATPVKK
jgi:hypothetical protein